MQSVHDSHESLQNVDMLCIKFGIKDKSIENHEFAYDTDSLDDWETACKYFLRNFKSMIHASAV